MNKQELFKKVANGLIDRFCEIESPNDCIKWLLQFGLTREEIKELYFNEQDIIAMEKELKEEEEQEEKERQEIEEIRG